MFNLKITLIIIIIFKKRDGVAWWGRVTTGTGEMMKYDPGLI